MERKDKGRNVPLWRLHPSASDFGGSGTWKNDTSDGVVAPTPTLPHRGRERNRSAVKGAVGVKTPSLCLWGPSSLGSLGSLRSLLPRPHLNPPLHVMVLCFAIHTASQREEGTMKTGARW